MEAGISLFAVLGFCYVPLGQLTALEHVKAVFATQAAQRAVHELSLVFVRVEGKLLGEVQEFASARVQPDLASAAGGMTHHGQAPHTPEPKPQVPRLGERMAR